MNKTYINEENIKEDYCTYEISKLLQKKGFKIGVGGMYVNSDNVFMTSHYADLTLSLEDSIHFDEIFTPTCTIQTAIKWLRLAHKVYISIRYVPSSKVDNIDSCYVVDIFNENERKWVPNSIVGNNFETTAEESLKLCLTELI